MKQALLVGLLFGASVVGLVATASSRQTLAHMAIAAVTALLLAGLGIARVRRATLDGAANPTVATRNAQAMSLIWCWGAVALLATYGPGGVLAWKEWWHFFVAFATATAVCLGFALHLDRAASTSSYGETDAKITRIATVVQLAGMLAVMIGLIVDGKMVRYVNPRFTDWAGNNIFFFGALGLAALSAFALINARKS